MVLRTDALAFGGPAVGRLEDGKVALVAGAAAGELVRARVDRERRSLIEATVEEVLEAAPERVDPACPVAGRCGGCSWIHIEPSAQRLWKERLLRAELGRVGLEGAAERVSPVVCGPPLGYRTRTRLHRRGHLLGTLERASGRLVPFDRCPVLAPDLELFARETAAAVEGTPPGDAEVELYSDRDGRRGLHVTLLGRESRRCWARLAAELGVVALRVVSRGRPSRAGRSPGPLLHETSLDRSLAFEPGVFVQANREMNQALVAAALGLAGHGASFLELYAGAGHFSVHLAGRFDRGEAVEANGDAVARLALNLEAAGGRVRVRREADRATAARLAGARPPELLLADPPRAGMAPLLSLLRQAPPERLVLVSCHPMAAMRDLRVATASGSRLVGLVPVDLFPGTHHLELVAALER